MSEASCFLPVLPVLPIFFFILLTFHLNSKIVFLYSFFNSLIFVFIFFKSLIFSIHDFFANFFQFPDFFFFISRGFREDFLPLISKTINGHPLKSVNSGLIYWACIFFLKVRRSPSGSLSLC